MEYYGYIYKVTNKKNNKIYIGMHKSQVFDETYYGSGVLIKKALKKYGKESFTLEVIEWGETRNDLCKKEQYWIEKFDARNPDIGYNIADGGDGGDIFHIQNIETQEEIRKKISQGNKGKKQTAEWIEKRKQYGDANPMYGKHLSEETKEKISKKLSAENNPMYGVQSPMYGKHHSEETKSKISATKIGDKNPNYGKQYTEKEKEHLSELFSGNKNPRAIPCCLLCVDTGETKTFDYIKEALDSVSILQSQYYYRKNKDGIMESPQDGLHYKIVLNENYIGGDTNE